MPARPDRSTARGRALAGGASGGGLGRVDGLVEIDEGGVAPEALEGVEAALLLEEDVDDEIDVVEEDPLGGAAPLDVARLHAEGLAEPFLDPVGYGGDLAVGRSVADEEVVREIAPAAKVERPRVPGLLVAGRIDGVEQLGPQRTSSGL